MFKKILYALTLMAVVASCKDDYKDWAKPLSNPEEPAQSVSFTVSNAPDVNYDGLTADSVQLFIPNTSVTTGATPVNRYDVKLYNDDQTVSAELHIGNDEAKIPASELKDIVEKLYGKRPVARNVNIDILAYTSVDEQQTIASTAKAKLSVTLKAPFIDTAYYLTGDFAGWNKDGALPFTHLGDGDVYDNPEFQIMFTVTAANQYWKIISGTNYNGDFWSEGEKGVVGTVSDGDTSFEGNLTTTSPQAGKIEQPGMYIMTINMMNYTYSIKSVAPQFFMVGAVPGWNVEGASKALLYPQSGTVMSYTTKYTGAWDLKLWNKNDLGNWDACYGSVVDGDNSPSGALINAGAQAISAPSAEYYTFTVDLAAMTYQWTKLDNQTPTEYTAMGVIGDFNGWGGDLAMTQVTPHNWYVVGTVTDGGLKFRANQGWDINWGADLSVSDSNFFGKGTQGGSNIWVPAGTYAFFLNDITGEFAIVKQ